MKKNLVRHHYNQATTLQLAIYGGLGLVLSYGFVSRALQTGSYWQYLACFLFLILSIKLFTRSLRIFFGNKQS